MTKSFQRFEILLPQRFNDGSIIPDEVKGQVVEELLDRFGAVSSETQAIQGRWGHSSVTYLDVLNRLFVDVVESEAESAKEFFAEYKEDLKLRFDQIDIWIATYPIEII